jgi:DNA-binding NarL/FixJ family response regulator
MISTETQRSAPYSLTPQELRVLYTLTEGFRNELQIAGRLRMAEAAVRSHLGSILRKMNAQSKTEAAIKAIRDGLFLEE